MAYFLKKFNLKKALIFKFMKVFMTHAKRILLTGLIKPLVTSTNSSKKVSRTRLLSSKMRLPD